MMKSFSLDPLNTNNAIYRDSLNTNNAIYRDSLTFIWNEALQLWTKHWRQIYKIKQNRLFMKYL